MFRYTVRCQFSDPGVVAGWLQWLTGEHVSDVLAAGATGAEIVHMDDDLPTYEIRYQFADRDAFEIYSRQHAPGLQAEGLNKFPLELGLEYSRTAGDVLFETRKDPAGPQSGR